MSNKTYICTNYVSLLTENAKDLTYFIGIVRWRILSKQEYFSYSAARSRAIRRHQESPKHTAPPSEWAKARLEHGHVGRLGSEEPMDSKGQDNKQLETGPAPASLMPRSPDGLSRGIDALICSALFLNHFLFGKFVISDVYVCCPQWPSPLFVFFQNCLHPCSLRVWLSAVLTSALCLCFLQLPSCSFQTIVLTALNLSESRLCSLKSLKLSHLKSSKLKACHFVLYD